MRMCALLVGLPDVTVAGVGDWPSWLRIAVAIDVERPACECGGPVHRHGVREVALVDLRVFGRPTRLVWRKQRWRSAAAELGCSWHEVMDAVDAVGEQLIDHPGQIGKSRRSGWTRGCSRRWVRPDPVVVDPDRRCPLQAAS